MSVQGRAQKHNKQNAIIIIVAVIVALLIFGGGAYLFTRIFTGHVRSAEEYPTTKLEATTYSNMLAVDGAVDAGSSVTVTAKVEGTVSVIAVSEGDKVKKGDVLFTMENSSITSARGKAYSAYTDAQEDESTALTNYKNAQSALTKANKALTKAQTALDDATAAAEAKQTEDPTYTFDSTPYDDAVTLAQSNVSTCETQVSTTKTAYEKAQKSTADAKDTYEEANESLENLTVKASAAGTVSNLNIEEGASSTSFNANGGAMKIVDTSSLCCVVKVPQSQVGNVIEGQSAVITCSNLEGQEFNATVSRIADTPSTTATTSTAQSTSSNTSSSTSASDNESYYDVTLALDKVPKAFKVGMACSASIHTQDFNSVFYVPKTAVATNNAGMYVEVVSDSTTTKQYSVTQIGVSDDGASLIVQGAYLSSGMSVRTDLSSGN